MAPFTLDMADFEQAAAQLTCPTDLQRAIELYRGDLLPGCYDDWLLPERERLRQTFSQTLEQLVLLLENERDYPAAIVYGQRLLQHDPLHEATYRRLMRLYALDGNSTGVQQTYHNCFKTLQAELGVELGPATRQFYERLVTTTTPAAQHHNLPVSLTPFVGRQEELTRLAAILANPACRLLTLVGPGGIGKSRLAIRAARLQLGTYLDGVYFVSCVATASVELLPATIAEALNFTFHGPTDPKEQLLNYLRQKEMLLVIDNFEHLLAGAELLLELLRGAPPGLKLLVTSRERLNVPPEWLFEVAGLSVPPDCLASGAAEDLETYDAVALFLQAVRRLQPDFSPSGPAESRVGCLCRLVQGMPLALELAAPWVRTLTCAEIVQEIERDLDFLTGSRRDAPDRHHSIRAVFDHSWRLLSAEEQRVLAGLSVFRGGFQRQAAHQVAGASLATLSALVDKSLLRFNPLGRYDLHELLRQYAFERLGETAGAKESALARHSQYYLEFMHQQTHPLHSHQQSLALLEF